jgi:hypothetical protein
MQLEQLTKQKGLIALSVHEVENFFLHRITLEGIAKGGFRLQAQRC